MGHLAPMGPVYQPGARPGNAVAMSAGLATLRELERQDGWSRLEESGREIEKALRAVLERAPFPARVVRVGSLLWMSLKPGDSPRSADALEPGVATRCAPVFHALLRDGVRLAPSAYEAGFLSLAHAGEHINRLCSSLARALEENVVPA